MHFFNKIKDRLKIDEFIVHSKLGRFLFLCFLSLSLIPLSIVCYTFYTNAYNSLYSNTFNCLTQSSLLKKASIINYYESLLKDINYYSKTKANIKTMERLTEAFNESGLKPDNFIHSDQWSQLKNDYVEDIQTAQSALNLQNIYYIDVNGNVLFSSFDNDLLGSNVFSYEYDDTSLCNACYKANQTGRVFISDIEFFATSNTTSNFIVQPVLSNDERKIGLIVFQVSSAGINSIVNIHTKRYKSYEAYVIGDDLVVKSSSKMIGDTPVVNRKIETEMTLKWLKQGKSKNVFNLPSDSIHEDKRNDYQYAILNASSYKGYRGNEVIGIFYSLDALEVYGLNWALFAEVDAKEAFLSLINLSKIVYILLAVFVLLIVFVSIPITKHIVEPIRKLVLMAKRLARREFDFSDNIGEAKVINNEIGELNLNFLEVLTSFKEISSVCQAIALGDLNKSIIIKSGHDIIGDSINTMSAYLRTIVKQANSIANNDYSVLVTPLSEHDELGQAIFNMTNTLMEVTIENKKQNWYKSCLAELNDRIRGEQDITKLCQKIISCMAAQLNAYVGAIYLFDDDNTLKLRGTYAYNSIDMIESEFKMGEGLIGQAALERKRFTINKIPEDYVRIKSASGESVPKHMLIFPVLFDNTLKAVIELGSFYDFNSQQLEYVDQACEYIAISIDVAKSHTRLTELLEETQQQSKDLQLHQNELKLSNETLKNITQELLNSEKQLKQQQEELKLANEALEEKSRGIEKKTEEVSAKNLALEKTKKELEDKARELEQISEYKSEFLANMSHELRTPLNSLLILARDLFENDSRNLTETQVEAAEIIYKSGNDLLDLINDILDISKVEAGKMTISITSVPLKDISDKIGFNFDRLAKEKGLDLNVTVDEDLPLRIQTDPQRIDQIIKNLISNAIKFTNKGSIDVLFSRPKKDVVFSKSNLKPETLMCISITDTGIGIPKDKQTTIFEAFRQADGSTSRKYGGTGLGLSISQELAVLLGGEIHVESEEGKGSTFSFYIPCDETVPLKEREKKHNRLQENKSQKVEDKSAVFTEENEKLVLLISDTKKEKKEIKNIFDTMKINYIYLSDPEETLVYAKDNKPGAIILNINKSAKKMNSVLDSLHNDSEASDIPVYLISSKIKSDIKGISGHIKSALNSESLKKVFEMMNESCGWNSGEINNEIETQNVDFDFHNKTILIVDDDMRNSFALSKIMEDKGMNVLKAPNGEEALKMLEKEDHIDIILMDIMMPVLDGYETMKIIRQKDDFSQLPIIALTAKAMEADKNKCMTCGANDYISKPVNIDKLLFSIKRQILE